MELNGTELEMKYVSQINQLLMAKAKPNVFDFVWVNKYRKRLKERLEKMNDDFGNGLIDKKAYDIWVKMINEAL